LLTNTIGNKLQQSIYQSDANGLFYNNYSRHKLIPACPDPSGSTRNDKKIKGTQINKNKKGEH